MDGRDGRKPLASGDRSQTNKLTREDVAVSPGQPVACVFGHCVLLHWGREVPGTVESSAKGIFLMANWREVLLCCFGAEKRVPFHTPNATDFSSWREQGLNF